jgi:putative addiction module CopG family antidote
MPTRNVVLTDYQSALIERLVRSGRYQNASEVLREGLRLVEQREAEEAARVEALRAVPGTEIDPEPTPDPDSGVPTPPGWVPAPPLESGAEYSSPFGTWRFLYRRRT